MVDLPILIRTTLCYIYTSQMQCLRQITWKSKRRKLMVVVDIIVAASAVLTLGVVTITAKFSKEMPVNKTFDELWFENAGEQSELSHATQTARNDANLAHKVETFAKAA